MLFKAHPVRDPGLRQITQGFGEHPEWYNRYTYDGVPLKGHNGIDFGVPLGSQVQAVDDGTVQENNYDPAGFGYYFMLRHTWGQSLYAHLSKPEMTDALAVGQPVQAGETLGLSGASGFSTGPHLHFGIRTYPYRRDDGWGGFSDPASCLQEILKAAPPDPDQIRQVAWTILSVPLNRRAALAQYARENNLGAPLTKEFTVGNYQCQGFALGIAYVQIGQWDTVRHTPW